MSTLQSGVSVDTDDLEITGTLLYNEGWASGYLKGPGNYLALKLTPPEGGSWSDYDSVLVGLDPSAGSGLQEIVDDDTHNLVAKVASTEQKFIVETRRGILTVRQEYDLSGLTLNES